MTSGKTLLEEVAEERIVKVLVIDSGHSEDEVFKLAYNYIHLWTPTLNLEDATIVNTYLEREGFEEWFAKRVKAFKKAEKSSNLVQNLKKIIHEDLSSSGSSGNSSWQQINSPSDNSLSGKSLVKDNVCLTVDHIPYLVSDRDKVCVNCNILGHRAGDLICLCVQEQNFPVDDRWEA